MFEIISKNEVKLLKKIIRLARKNNSNEISLELLNIKTDDFYLFQLISKKLIVLDGSSPWGGSYEKVKITDKGQKYFEYKWEETKFFLKRSVIAPMVVSLLTTIVTLWINSFFN